MGLMYLFPTEPNEKDHVTVETHQVTVKSYGLPYIFWAYAAAILLVELAMYLAVRTPLAKLASIGDSVDQFIYFSLNAVLLSVPLTLFVFFFFEKVLSRQGKTLWMKYRVLGLTFKTTEIKLKDGIPFQVGHFIDSPNMARIKDEKAMKNFQNKGYFELFALNDQGETILIDRHTRKADLEKLVGILELGSK